MIQLVRLSLLLLIAANLSCTSAKKEAMPYSPEQTGYVDAGNEVRLYYRLVGSGPDTVVVIHGGPGFTMDYLLEDLRPLATNHVLIFYDQRGTGGSTLVSDSVSLTAQRSVEDLDALRKHFRIKRLNILGHSWGTAIVAMYAISFPDHLRKIISVGVLPLHGQQFFDALKQLGARSDTMKMRQMSELYTARLADPTNEELCRQYYMIWFEPFYGDGNNPPPRTVNFCAGSPESLRNKLNVDKYTFASLGEWNWREPLSNVQVPSLIIHGKKDPLPFEGAQDWADVLKNSELLLLDSVGHFPSAEAPDKFIKAVDDFLKK